MNRLANPFAPRRALPEKSRQIKAWVRELCKLDDAVVVSITELACRDDGCPDIETVIGIMRPGEKIETIRIHRAIAEVMREDVAGAVSNRNRAVPD
ncbi:nitrate reductase [Phyllobacterium zundukense]|uniref:Nitrate reductase n=1 Tax=Phyllobacterium zundukense TaxID=1867719 RepID=A0A2N9VYL2_9HYPH|nr:nitrate reductase [Phyllobacterium zundukense]ATU95168.1 nitrate reductase [Phyllobacterium zundukense]PIO44580.1 nitrate reductase [Phyllobacterium zundukense]